MFDKTLDFLNDRIDFRFTNDKELAEVRQIAQKVAETSYIEGTTCKLVLESLRDAMDLCDKNLELLERVNEIFKSVNLSTVTYRSAGGGSDAAYTTKCGIPTLESIGVRGGNIHSQNEFARISSLKESAKRLVAICCYI